MKERGLTVIEIIVVTAIVVLLLALLFPVASLAKKKAYGAQETSQLKSLGVAHSLYESDYDDKVLATSIPLVIQKYVPSSSVQISLDPFPNGWANEDRHDPVWEGKTNYKDSFRTLMMSAGDMFHEEFRQSSSGGWLISAGESLSELRGKAIFQKVLYKRLTFSGSVVVRRFKLVGTSDGVSMMMDRCFSEDPIIDNYVRDRGR